MGKINPQLQLLYDSVRRSGIDPIHMPYTAFFENHFEPRASRDQKHRLYESLLELHTNASFATPSAAQGGESVATEPSQGARNEPRATTTSPVVPGLGHDPQTELFESAPVLPLQSWRIPPRKQLTEDQEQRRAWILEAVGNSRLGRREYKIAYLLHHFPETRDSDTTLCIYYWRRYQAEILEQAKPFDLEVLYDLERIETIGRLRRVIQNTLGLYRGKAKSLKARQAIQAELSEYLASRTGITSEIRFYFDETGNEGANKLYRGIAGICVMNWKYFSIHHGALSQWRRRELSMMPIHFCDIGESRVPEVLRLLKELEARRGGLLFVGHAVHSRGRTAEDYVSMIIQLVLDSLRRADSLGSLNEPRTVRVIKEADGGFDAQYLSKLDSQLRRTVEEAFPGRLVVEPIEAMQKGNDVLLECADLIAGGMQRRALYGGRNPKDQLAEAIITTAGFEDAANDGAVFRYHVPFSS